MNRRMLNCVVLCIVAFLWVISMMGCGPMRNEEPLKICFIRDGNVWVMDEDGSNQIQLTNSGNDYNPSWSTDGRYIVFSRDISGYGEIFLIDSNGKNQTRLTYTQDDENYFTHTWLLDTSGIVYARRFVDTYYIGIMNTQGIKLKEYIATGVNSYTTAITVSPDSSKACYVWGDANTIGCIDLKTGINVPNPYNMIDCYTVTFAPQGETIAYIEDNNPNIIHFFNLASLQTIDYILAYSLSSSSTISFSPSGENIVFVFDLDMYIYNIRSNETKFIASDVKNPCFMGKPR